MTAEMSYSYLDLNFVVRINDEVMNRAVRVKVAAKDKIKRIFGNNIASLSSVSENTSLSSEVAEEKGLAALIDTSEENLVGLNDKVNAMIVQPNVSYVEKRAVLFTKALATKIKGVNEKMFDGMPVSKREVVSVEPSILPNVEISNHLGGDVLSSVWTNVPENIESLVSKQNDMVSGEETTIVQESALQEMESGLPNLEATPVSLDENDSKEIVLPGFVPEFDGGFVAEPVVPVEESEEVSADVSLAQNDVPKVELPGFMPELGEDFVAEPASLNEPVALESEESQEVSSFDYVAEPKMIGEEEYVNEPSVISSFEEEESPSFSNDVEVPSLSQEIDEVPVEMSVEPEVEPEKPLSIEDRIAELLNRKNAIHQEQEVSESVSVEESQVDEKDDVSMRREIPELTQAGIVARIQRINNTMKEKDAALKSVTSKYEIAKQDVAAAKQKIAGYEEVVSDLTIRNNALIKENEKLNSKVEEAQSVSQSTIAKLEAQVSELTEAKNLESENSKKAIADLKSKHEMELIALREKHAKELALANETRDKQMQAILGTLSEALGETNLEQEYDGHSLAA